ncbi:MAG: HYExAFE family protein [Planctomycetota bacterium]|jgi:hypothetical protein
MRDFTPNHYERAFENWLIDNHIRYVAVDESKKTAFGRSKVKSFDFLLYPRNPQKDHQVIIAEVKGRLFKGATLARLTGLECWVTTDDVDGLVSWQRLFGRGHLAVFVFAYQVEKIDVDFDGRGFYDFADNRYVFFAIKLDDYRRFMKRRSPKWKTVNLPADKFRQCVLQIQQLLF